MEETRCLAQRLAKGPTAAIKIAKTNIDSSLIENFEGQLENERQAVCETAMTNDFVEGVKAFIEKRKPIFKRKLGSNSNQYKALRGKMFNRSTKKVSINQKNP